MASPPQGGVDGPDLLVGGAPDGHTQDVASFIWVAGIDGHGAPAADDRYPAAGGQDFQVAAQVDVGQQFDETSTPRFSVILMASCK